MIVTVRSHVTNSAHQIWTFTLKYTNKRDVADVVRDPANDLPGTRDLHVALWKPCRSHAFLNQCNEALEHYVFSLGGLKLIC